MRLPSEFTRNPAQYLAILTNKIGCLVLGFFYFETETHVIELNLANILGSLSSHINSSPFSKALVQPLIVGLKPKYSLSHGG